MSGRPKLNDLESQLSPTDLTLDTSALKKYKPKMSRLLDSDAIQLSVWGKLNRCFTEPVKKWKEEQKNQRESGTRTESCRLEPRDTTKLIRTELIGELNKSRNDGQKLCTAMIYSLQHG